MELLVIILAIIMGALLIIIKSFNMLLGQQIGIYASNLVNHITGVMGSSVLFVTALLLGASSWTLNPEAPAYVFLGGIIGSIFVVLSNYSFSKTSVVTSTILILCGQFISSLAIDMFILKMQIKPTTFAGALLIITGTILYNIKEKKDGLPSL